MATQNMQRVGFLACVPAMLRHYGVDPIGVLAAVNLGPSALDDPNAVIPYKTMGKLLEWAANSTGCVTFGLEVGRQIRISTLGILGDSMRNSPTLRVALHEFAINQHRNAHGCVVYLHEGPRDASFGYAIYEQDMPGIPLVYDGFIMAACNVIHELSSKTSPAIAEIHVASAQPGDLAPYEALGAPLRFNAKQTAVMIPRKLLDQRIPGAQVKLLPGLAKAICNTLHAGERDFVTELRSMLKAGLLKGRVSSSEVSALLGISHRTVSRRLAVLGYRYHELLDEARREFAHQLLDHTDISVKDISAIVGYADPSALTRAFIRWKGVNPSTWRRQGARATTSV
jgi:AraC-like DNA-binding protein